MHEKPLLLSPAKSGVLVPTDPIARLRLGAAAVGMLMVLIGAADLTARAAHGVLGENAGRVAFGPALSAVDPTVLGGVSTTTGAIVPARLKIPAIGVNATVEQVGKKADGTMGTPTTFGDVAWYALGSKPGEPGNAVIAGHVDNALTTAGVFEHLNDLKVGDYITVEDESSKTLVYRVSSTTSYPVDQAPVAQIFATSGPSRVVLITCTGDWDGAQKQFNERLVVIAELTH